MSKNNRVCVCEKCHSKHKFMLKKHTINGEALGMTTGICFFCNKHRSIKVFIREQLEEDK